jgi:hypothetical protein
MLKMNTIVDEFFANQFILSITYYWEKQNLYITYFYNL